MRAPRRYRAALRAYPAAYRRERGPELLATLGDGDDDRGGPSVREAGALAYRGLEMRARAAASPEGMLVAAAVLVLVALTGGFGWSERVFLFRGDPAAFATDGPGVWWQVALAVVALVVLALGPSRALESPRRGVATVLLAVPLSLAVFTTPGRIFEAGLPDAGTVAEFLSWLPGVVFRNWELTLPTTLAAVAGTALALTILRLVGPAARRRALAGALALLACVAVVQTWRRPGLSTEDSRSAFTEYGQSAFADLEPGAFIALAGLLLALLALVRRPLRAAEPSAPRSARR